jgi:hypothetical protein
MSFSIPPDRRQAVRLALERVFGTAEPHSVVPVGGGLSEALVLRVAHQGQTALLRIEQPPDGLRDPVRQYACLRAAASAGIAPELLYADAEGGVAISRFIEARPLAEHGGGRAGLLQEVAQLAAGIRATPPFPPLVPFLDGVDSLVERLEGFGLIDPRAIAPHLGRYREIRNAYPWDAAALVSSHNDLHPRNLVYDGGRLWVVDWEAAFRNDPYVDLAVAANFFGADKAEERLLLETSFGAPPEPQVRARFSAMRQLCRVYHGVVLINSAAAAGCAPSTQARSMAAPPLEEVRRALGEGRLDLAQPEQRLVLGKAMLGAMLDESRTRRFERQLECLAA